MNQQQLIEDVICEEFDKIHEALSEFEQEVELTRQRRISSEYSKFGGVRDF